MFIISSWNHIIIIEQSKPVSYQIHIKASNNVIEYSEIRKMPSISKSRVKIKWENSPFKAKHMLLSYTV